MRDEYNYPKKKGIKDECSRLLEATTMRSRRGFFFSSRRQHTRLQGDWSSDVCSSDLDPEATAVFPRLLASERLAGDSEPAGPDLASVTRPAERSSDDELPTAIQAPPAAGAPEPTQIGRASCRERV